MRIWKPIAAAAAAAIPLAMLASTSGAGASTPSCGRQCVNVFSKEFGHHFVLDVLHARARVGQPIILFQASSHDGGQDFTYAFQGTVDDFYSLGLVSPGVELHYKRNPAFEIEYSPYGVGSNLCVGVAKRARWGRPVNLQWCGATSKTVWIVVSSHRRHGHGGKGGKGGNSNGYGSGMSSGDNAVPAAAPAPPPPGGGGPGGGGPGGGGPGGGGPGGGGPGGGGPGGGTPGHGNGHGHRPVFVALINGSNRNFSHPFVLNYPGNGAAPWDRPRTQLTTGTLTSFSDGTVFDNQLWSAFFGTFGHHGYGGKGGHGQGGKGGNGGNSGNGGGPPPPTGRPSPSPSPTHSGGGRR